MGVPVREALQPTARQGPAPAGAAALPLRRLLDAPLRPARVIAVFPAAVYIEVRGVPEPRVLAIVAEGAVRLPNAVVLVVPARDRPFARVREGAEAWIGEGCVETCGLRVKARRWWDPTPVLAALSPASLAHGIRGLEVALRDAGPAAVGGLAGHRGPTQLAEACADGDLAGAVEAAERIVGLGPGLTPSGDDVLAGLLVAARLLGRAVRGGGPAVWLADWLGAAVTEDADTRTTALAATLLHCAAKGQAGGEVAAVLRGIAGHEPPGPAVRRLLTVGHTSGADLAWGVLAGCRAALSLAARHSPTPRPQTVNV
ncbi:DUF2877 domain-containing protein [Actinomadura rupiterrae]|uniref:DUF2877 domain-containing protein n=1 Tax=Actinomadura rupiterrae TaxID=559627 RepID=UPI0020A2FE04|nr:DUF2877 domain-containing protein [Actinomadura rupiterrae]MCP2338360.1 hypothetical protein [Actinomadura rupiterrae]